MGIIVGLVFIVFGLVMSGIVMSVARNLASAGTGMPEVVTTTLHGVIALGVVMCGVGVLLLVTGLRKAITRSKLAKEIFARGSLTKGTVTFADKNYSVLVNGKPIFSSVEFTYQDSAGKPHTGRKDNVNSDLVIRDKIVVGSLVAVKYLPENPDKNILILEDPTANQPRASA